MPTRKHLRGGENTTVLDGVTLPLVYSAESERKKPTAYWAVREAGITLHQAQRYDVFLRQLTSGIKKRLAEGRN